jgi:4-hydroxythreonine-4-phosphate dehydrogenase
MTKPILAITAGDMNGIGPEVVLKALAHPRVRSECTPLLVGPASVFSAAAKVAGKQSVLSKASIVEPAGIGSPVPRPGLLSQAAGRVAGLAIEKAVELVQAGEAAGIVTAPVSKHALHLAGFNVPGQTEMLQELTGSPGVAMMLVSRAMKVGLATIHIPIKTVSRALTFDLLTSRIRIIHQALRQDWKVRKPRLAVLALNPHAGEGGAIGNEEARVIIPALAQLRKEKMNVEGPFPADAFFGRGTPDDYDAVVAMYHDQGLIPLKLTARGAAVNVSVGLPIIRTSPDHGTAFDIAGRGRAYERSMVEAICLAALFARNRTGIKERGKR